jgi:hypothetical protein
MSSGRCLTPHFPYLTDEHHLSCINPHALRVIEELDQSISSHSFRPQYVLAGIGLRAALEKGGRLISIKIMGIWEHNAWLPDQAIVLLEHQRATDQYWFHLQQKPIIDYGTT